MSSEVKVLPLTPAVVRKRMHALSLQLSSTIAAYNGAMSLLRERCTHDWQYESDPSGNNDSGYSCSACGSTRKRLAKQPEGKRA